MEIKIDKILTIEYNKPRRGYLVSDPHRKEYITKRKITITWRSKKINTFFANIKNIKTKIKKFFYKEIEKYYSFDIGVWEKKIRVIGINIYKQSVFLRDKNKVKIRYKLWIPKTAQKKYGPTITEVYITHEEWVNEYKCNKYLVPVNYKIPEDFLKQH